MKITRSQLIQIIQEELGQIDEIEIFGRTFGKKARMKKWKKEFEKRRKEEERRAREEEQKGEALGFLYDDLVSFINGVAHRVVEMRRYLMIPDHYGAIWGAWRHISSALNSYFEENGVDICPEMEKERKSEEGGDGLGEYTEDVVRYYLRCLWSSDVADVHVVQGAYKVFSEASKAYKEKMEAYFDKRDPIPTFDREAWDRDMAKLRPGKQGQEWGEVEGDYEYSMEERIMQKVKKIMEKK